MRVCSPPPNPSDSRFNLAPDVGIDPTRVGFGDRPAGHSYPVIGSSPRTRTWNVEFNRLAPVPVGTVRNGAGCRSRTEPHWFGRPAQSPNCKSRKWCPPTGSNGILHVFSVACAPATQEGHGCRGASRTRLAIGYEPRWVPDLRCITWSQEPVTIRPRLGYGPKLGASPSCVVVDDHGNDPCRCRHLLLSRVYKTPPRTCAIVRAIWSGRRESNPVIHVGNVTRNPSRTDRIILCASSGAEDTSHRTNQTPLPL